MFGRTYRSEKKPNFDKTTLFPLVLKLGDFLKKGFDHYVQLKASGTEVNVEIVAAYLTIQMASWEPTVKGKPLLDPETKAAAAKFIAGVARNMAKEQE